MERCAVPPIGVWEVVVPVKLLSAAKSRLAVPPDVRLALALAMAGDTVEAALACAGVRRVLAVTNDAVAADTLASAGAHVVDDEPDAGLNAALVHGAGQVAADTGVVALGADLPAMSPADLSTALTAARQHPRTVVADAGGRGTTLLAAQPGHPLAPAFGLHSLDRHISSGAVPLPRMAAGLRRDVDTLADLAVARGIGLGRRTAAVLARL